MLGPFVSFEIVAGREAIIGSCATRLVALERLLML